MLLLASCAGGALPQNQEDSDSANLTTPTAIALPAATAVDVVEPTIVAEPEPSGDESPQEQATEAEPLIFQIVSDGTEARFIVEEVLLGNNKTVTGVTDQITGEIFVIPSDPTSAQIGIISINARTLATDSSRRNRSIQRQILLTAKNEYQFITFEPTKIEGMPSTIDVGDTFDFMVVGDLTIVETTRSETFQMTVTVLSNQELKGLASLTILHAEYGLTIPNVPIVASVEDEVRLELEFTAKTTE